MVYKTVYRLSTCVALCFLISSCALSPEEQARQQAQERIKQQMQENAARQLQLERRASTENQCLGYGFARGTTPFSQCVMQIDVAQQAASQRQQQLQQQRDERYSRCKFAEAQAWATPGKNAMQAVNSANATFENCMAGLPPVTPMNVVCDRLGPTQIQCRSQ